ncbi:MAG: tail fiber domain-containing protein [Acidobacteriota bacterium]|nr:tail fiber domain-containing protein [Acidobacteriota bacterium]
MKNRSFFWKMLFSIVLFAPSLVLAQTTEFTYQGKLTENNNAQTATYDFEFDLYDAETGGTLLGTQLKQGVAVTNGIFTVRLDFGAQFSGAPRFLEIRVRPAGGGAFTTLNPRQPITSAPHTIRSLSSADSEKLGSIAASGFIQNTTTQQTANFNVSGNGTIGGGLTVGGTFSPNIVNAQTQYNIAGNRVFSVGGSQNVFAGQNAGTANTTGFGNAFVGHFAGNANTTGSNNSFFGTDAGRNNNGSGNSFFGRSAGYDNTTGTNNSFFGLDAGRFNTAGSRNSFFGRTTGFANTSGNDNSFFGHTAGDANTTGEFNSFFGSNAGGANVIGNNNSFFGTSAGAATNSDGNSFFGRSAGAANTTGLYNSFFGLDAGRSNNTGNNNSFFGRNAGYNTTEGIQNTFIGRQAGFNNTTGSNNTTIGYNSNVGAVNLNYATAIGAEAVVLTSDTIALGRSGGQDTVQVPGNLTVGGALNANLPANDADYIQNRITVQASSNFNISGTGTANKFNSSEGYFINNNRVLSTAGLYNLFAGIGTGQSNTTGQQNTFVGERAGQINDTGTNNSYFGFNTGNDATGTNNTFVGAFAGGLSTSGSSNTFLGYFTGADNRTGTSNTLVGANADVGADNLNYATAIGAGSVVSTSNTIVLGRSVDDVRVPGNLVVLTLGSAGSTDICRNASNQLSTCSSSLRYKTNVQTFNAGLDVVKRLRPIVFDWKQGGKPDVGFAAEEVAEVEPHLTTNNDKGEIEGVKYAQITTVLVNAVKEQNAQIEKQNEQIQAQQEQIKRQQHQIEALKKLVCRTNAQADVCNEKQNEK